MAMAEDGDGSNAQAEDVKVATPQELGDKQAAGQQEEIGLPQDVRLGKIEGLTFPVMGLPALLNPAAIAYALLLIPVKGVNVLVPHEQTSAFLKKQNIPFYIMLGFLVSVRIVAVTAPSYRVWFISISAYAFVCVLFDSLMTSGNILAGPVFSVLLLIVAKALRCQGQWGLCAAQLLVYNIVLLPVLVGLRYIHPLMELITNSFVKGFIPPLLSSILSTAFPICATWVFMKLGRPGLHPYAVSCPIAFSVAGASAIKLTSLMANAHDTLIVLGSLTSMLLADTTGRLPCWQWMAARNGVVRCCMSSTFEAVDDCYLRLRFSTSYLPIMPACMTAGVAAVAGATWPRAPAFWSGLIIYFVYSVIVDLALVMVQRARHPASTLESVWGTFHRLSTEPRANWPKYQKQASPPSSSEVWAPSCLDGLCCGYLTDGRAMAAYLAGGACSGLAIASFTMFYTDCYILNHPDFQGCE